MEPQRYTELSKEDRKNSLLVEMGMEADSVHGVFSTEAAYRSWYEPIPLEERADTPLKRWLLETPGIERRDERRSDVLYGIAVRRRRKNLYYTDSKRDMI